MNLSEALKVTESGEIFSCKVVAFDHKRKTGGHIKFYPELVHSKSTDFIIPSTKSETKAQNHFENATRNFLKCANGQPTSVVRKIHIILMLEVNGQKVML